MLPIGLTVINGVWITDENKIGNTETPLINLIAYLEPNNSRPPSYQLHHGYKSLTIKNIIHSK